ncbi:MmcQ/YjbR family DNA-binding protein [Nocardioides sp. AE5]|uniref:MmcQ/YjbR family DNA-binding protein n=1 Tax=Nocardioides sp. AE5 TaxID=2962573 RepID=UPI002882D264|nr:MmcQ/YjbR family DNA-binding protein [Nocardioides sp. AE5]MDT0202969.1 MmcQ/YjbR family DNA-binding protein [Nocardioides sp. AE5]
MAHPVMYDDDNPHLVRLRALVLAYPGAEEYVSHGRPNFRVKKNFVVFGGSERLGPGEHRQVDSALMVKVEEAEQAALDEDERFFVPAYLGAFGWRALDLAAPGTDWDEVAELVDASYRLTAPKRMIAALDAGGIGPG